MSGIDPTLAALDIMLVDQILRGRIAPGCSVLDIGCGGGRNLGWFLAHGHPCCGIDPDSAVITGLAGSHGARGCRLLVGALPTLPLDDERFDLVIVNAVLHFAPHATAFAAWFAAAAERVAPGGRLFIRCASRLAWPGVAPCDDSGRVIDPRCHFSFLPDMDQIEAARAAAGLGWHEVPKTSVVGDQRCMSTLIFSR